MEQSEMGSAARVAAPNAAQAGLGDASLGPSLEANPDVSPFAGGLAIGSCRGGDAFYEAFGKVFHTEE